MSSRDYHSDFDSDDKYLEEWNEGYKKGTHFNSVFNIIETRTLLITLHVFYVNHVK